MSCTDGTAKLTNHGTRSHPSNSAVAYSEIADLMLALTLSIFSLLYWPGNDRPAVGAHEATPDPIVGGGGVPHPLDAAYDVSISVSRISFPESWQPYVRKTLKIFNVFKIYVKIFVHNEVYWQRCFIGLLVSIYEF